MNPGKARDYFSAYYEGSLDRGLRVALETRLREDATLNAEYKAFTRTMRSLEAFGAIEIEPPADLHEKIAARLDRAVWEQNRDKRPAGFAWWKGLLGAAATAAVLFIGYIGFVKTSNSNQAGLIPVGGASEAQFRFTAQNGSVLLSLPAVPHETVTIHDSAGHLLGDPIELINQGINNKPLTNEAEQAKLVSIDADQGPAAFLALPGKIRDTVTGGKGTVKDLAVAVASHYGIPVALEVKDDANQNVSWDFNAVTPDDAASNAVKPLGLAVQMNSGGIILIEKN